MAQLVSNRETQERDRAIRTLSPTRKGLSAASGILPMVVAVNIVIIWPMLFLEYSARTESAEPNFFAIIREIRECRCTLDWWPAWYHGTPLGNVYPPLVNVLSAIAGSVFDWTNAHSYHVVVGLLYALGPCALFAFACEFSAVLRDHCGLGELSLFSRGGPAEREPQNHTHT